MSACMGMGGHGSMGWAGELFKSCASRQTPTVSYDVQHSKRKG
jgi:hypothetical protein